MMIKRGNAKNMELALVKVETQTRQALLDALCEIGYKDSDFSGVNGKEYLWTEAAKKGYESNLTYVLDAIKDIESDIDLIRTFFQQWMGSDSYYIQYEWGYHMDDDGFVSAIAVSWVY